MSKYFNDEGEPLMTAAEARLEDELDEMSRHEPMDAEDYADRYGRLDAEAEAAAEWAEMRALRRTD